MSGNPWADAAGAEMPAAEDAVAGTVPEVGGGAIGHRPFGVRFLGGLWRYLFGAVLCWFAVGAVLVVGWTQRRTRRGILHRWWSQSPARQRGVTFEAFLAGGDLTADLLHPPRWILGVPWCDAGARRLVGGLGRNLREGFGAVVNVFLYTLPAGLLWSAGWFAGWQVSFHKGYEESMVGRGMFLAGMALFIPALFYVPLAQARQAAGGEAARFHDVRLVAGFLRRHWLGGSLLAAAYFAMTLPVTVLRIAPFALGNTDWVAGLNPEEQLRAIQAYHLAAGLVVFPGYVGLRLLAGRLYARAVLAAVRAGSLGDADLSALEWDALHRLELVGVLRPRAAGWLLVAARWLGSRMGRIVAFLLAATLWFLLVWQVLVAEFFNFHRYGRGWWNQPLIQLPWFDHTPLRLYREVREWRDAGRPPATPVPAVDGRPDPAVPVPGGP